MNSTEIWFDWSSLFFFSGILNAFLVIIIIASRHPVIGIPSSSKWIMLLMFAIIIILAEQIIRNSELLYLFPGLLFLSTPLLFLYLPFIFFYYQSILEKDFKIWPHLILPGIILWVMLPTYFMDSSEKLKMFNSIESQDPYWITFLYLLYFIFYMAKIFRANISLRKLVKNNSTDNRVESFEQSNNIITVISFLALIFPISLNLQYFEVQEKIYLLSQKILFILFSASGHLALVGYLISKETIGNAFAVEPTSTTETAVVSPEILDIKKEELLQIIKLKKLYLQSNLTLNILAEEIGSSRTNLSYIINKGFGQNFYDLINSFRVEAVENKILNGDHEKYSLEHIVLESGFNSYTSFYRIFKRVKKQSPSQFLKSLKN